ncbi:MAG TPA: protein-L-isoaspartate(D-aspartate) O-methyltransferase [Deltaproteobacteria bacterium]|nr:protein-L-isoaspartate(D-aspartate) O-methyltransferase [Deltaproteobacteria bacterium]
MVDTQLVARGIHDPDVIRAMSSTPRHRFVPQRLRHAAYQDRPLPLDPEQTISQPYIVALMAELGRVSPGDRVLDVGTGSGYQAAVLANLGAQVWSIERLPELLETAAAHLAELELPVQLRAGDGKEGWPEAAPFDAILVAAAAAQVPPRLLEQLGPEGRLVVPIGDENHQELLVLERTPWGELRRQSVTEVRFVPLI